MSLGDGDWPYLEEVPLEVHAGVMHAVHDAQLLDVRQTRQHGAEVEVVDLWAFHRVAGVSLRDVVLSSHLDGATRTTE